MLVRCIIVAAALVAAGAKAACPLEGTWDTGFTTENGQTHLRLVHTFDCSGHTVLKAYFTAGQLLQGMAEVWERTGTYRIAGPSAAVPGAFDVDVTIEDHKVAYLDPKNIEFVRQGKRCGDPATTRVLMDVPLLGKDCDGVKMPQRGFIERGLAKIDGHRMIWSAYAGQKPVVIQAANETPRRETVLDEKRVFVRQ